MACIRIERRRRSDEKRHKHVKWKMIFVNWKLKCEKWEFWRYGGGVKKSPFSVTILEMKFCLRESGCNRFLNANKCHQSIFILMVVWLIAVNFSQTNEPFNEKNIEDNCADWCRVSARDAQITSHMLANYRSGCHGKCNLPPTFAPSLTRNVQLWVFCCLYCKLISSSELIVD